MVALVRRLTFRRSRRKLRAHALSLRGSVVKRLIFAAAATALLSATWATPTSAAAEVLRIQADGECDVSAGDIPALPNGAEVTATVTFVKTPGGGLLVSCSGELLPGVSVPQTVQGYLRCFASETAFVWAHYVVTASGHVQITCIFPAGSV